MGDRRSPARNIAVIAENAGTGICFSRCNVGNPVLSLSTSAHQLVLFVEEGKRTKNLLSAMTALSALITVPAEFRLLDSRF
jgi:hypothetical protein